MRAMSKAIPGISARSAEWRNFPRISRCSRSTINRMTAESLFSICSMLVLPGWVLLVFLPRWSWTQRIAAGIVPLVLAIAYLVLIVTNFRKILGEFCSLHQVSQLFQNPYNLLAGWVHYLAFDLFTVAWEVRDVARLR